MAISSISNTTPLTKPIETISKIITNLELDDTSPELELDGLTRPEMIAGLGSIRRGLRLLEPLRFDMPVEMGGMLGNIGETLKDVAVKLSSRLRTRSDTIQRVIKKVAPSIVNVRCMDENGKSWSGSGTIVNPSEMFPGVSFPANSYLIITNNHVVPPGETKRAVVTLANDKVLNAKVVVSPINKASVQDRITDCAILIVQSDTPLPAAKIADKLPKEGEVVIVGGHPLNLPRMSFTAGIVSQVAQETGQAIPAIQHDAEINPGNSGGPLFNGRGELIGTNTFTVEDTKGISFAIPTIVQRSVLNTMLKKGEFVRGYFGYDIQALSPFERDSDVVTVNTPAAKVIWVDHKSEAYSLGLRPGDVVSSISCSDGSNFSRNIDNPFEVTQFLQWMHSRRPGSKIEMQIHRRNGSGEMVSEQISLTVGKLEKELTALKSDMWGFVVEKDERGLFSITEVEPGGPAAVRGIRSNGRWVLAGVRVKEFSKQPIPIDSLDILKSVLIAARDNYVPTLDLVVIDKRDPKSGIKMITLKRETPDLISMR